MPDSWTLFGLIALAFHAAGAASAIHAIMKGRTPQGVMAWMFFLVMFPYLAVPLYWVLGPRRYEGYIQARLAFPTPFDETIEVLRNEGAPFVLDRASDEPAFAAIERLVRLPFMGANDVQLLIDGHATFDAIFEAIRGAQDYVLVQFFIVKGDGIGRRLAEELMAAAKRGVRVHFLFDEIGSRTLPDRLIAELRAAGVRIHPFATTRRSHRFQLNFRNHRKVVVVDGREALIGGINVGDEYLGLHKTLTPWRDTFVRVEGPAVQPIQLSFLEDWHWATDETPAWNWTPTAAPSGKEQSVLVLPTGPADPMESCSLAFVALLHAARDRVWISTPYFVFDTQIQSALQLAALRGVDVRILVPKKGDQIAADLAGWSYFEDVLASGARIYLYAEGFLHQKAVLVDDDLALIGTMNLDNRSMRLNFEIGVLVEDLGFAREVEAMLERDLERCEEATRGGIEDKGRLFRFGTRVARLFAPIL